MKPPAFQFYADDFLGGTLNFSDAEVGLYIRLLCVQWSTGGLPDDDAELSSYGRGETNVARIKRKFDKCEDGPLRNARLEHERAKQESFRASRSENGRHGGRPKASANLEKPSANLVVLKTEAKKSSPSPVSVSPQRTTKLPESSVEAEWGRLKTEITARFDAALGSEWENDRQKWMGRIKHFQIKAERVLYDLEDALKDGTVKTSPAAYAEHRWNEFK